MEQEKAHDSYPHYEVCFKSHDRLPNENVTVRLRKQDVARTLASMLEREPGVPRVGLLILAQYVDYTFGTSDQLKDMRLNTMWRDAHTLIERAQQVLNERGEDSALPEAVYRGGRLVSSPVTEALRQKLGQAVERMFGRDGESYETIAGRAARKELVVPYGSDVCANLHAYALDGKRSAYAGTLPTVERVLNRMAAALEEQLYLECRVSSPEAEQYIMQVYAKLGLSVEANRGHGMGQVQASGRVH